MIEIDPDNPVPLVTQIYDAVRAGADNGTLRAGTRLPSIRALARECKVSTLTVTNAYNRLVAEGYLEARPGSGYFLPKRAERKTASNRPSLAEASIDSSWLLQRVFQDNAAQLPVGCGWLPNDWLDTDGIRQALGALARKPGQAFSRYGTPYGYLPLRRQIQLMLAAHQIEASTEQIILTHGATHALDLVARCLLRPRDTVFVDDPGYCNIFPALRSLGVRLVGVPRTPDGPDVAALEALVHKHRPKVFFTSSTLQNPTGTTCTPAVAYRILRLSEQHDFYLVEDDIFGELHPKGPQNLAGLDQLQRVIYINSFSKTISPCLRVGYLACDEDLAEKIAYLKMASGLTTSEMSEQTVQAILVEGHHRSHLARLRDKLAIAQDRVCDRLLRAGLRLFHRPESGLFVWAKLDDAADLPTLVQHAAKAGIILAPGSLFRPEQRPTPWFRFNVAYANDDALYRFLDGHASGCEPSHHLR